MKVAGPCLIIVIVMNNLALSMEWLQLIEIWWHEIQGLRPTIPSQTYPKLVELLERCWQQDPSLRPEFSEIVEILQQMAMRVLVLPFSFFKSRIFFFCNLLLYWNSWRTRECTGRRGNHLEEYLLLGRVATKAANERAVWRTSMISFHRDLFVLYSCSVNMINHR